MSGLCYRIERECKCVKMESDFRWMADRGMWCDESLSQCRDAVVTGCVGSPVIRLDKWRPRAEEAEDREFGE
jgi:hypothetical protein